MSKEFLFDVKFLASVPVRADNITEAKKLLKENLDGAFINAGAWPDGNPIVFTASVDSEVCLIDFNDARVGNQTPAP